MLDNRNFLLPDATFVIEMVAFAVGARDADRRRRDADGDAIRAEARREAQLIIEQARSMRDHLIAEGRTTGVEEYRWLAGRADRELQRRTALARDQLRRQARTAAIAAVRVYLGSDTDLARVTALVDEELDALEPGEPAESRRGVVAA
jgi:F0F1-type ATP synthase membrane subunit b/b'